MSELKIEYVNIDDLKPYEKNAKIHTEKQVFQIEKSIKEFGFNDPIAVWNDEIVEGHGRMIAAQRMGMKEVPIIRLDNLTDEQRRAYMLVHNKLTMNSGFDFDVLVGELSAFSDVDMSAYGFELFDMPDIDALFIDSDDFGSKKVKTVRCPGCGYEFEL